MYMDKQIYGQINRYTDGHQTITRKGPRRRTLHSKDNDNKKYYKHFNVI